MSSFPQLTGAFGNDPNGSRPEPGSYLRSLIVQLLPGEVPEGRAEFTYGLQAPARERSL